MQTRLSHLKSMFFVLVLLSLCIGSQAWADGPLAVFTVEAGEYERVDTPVSASLAGIGEAAQSGLLRLEEVKGDERIYVPAQIEAGPTPKLWWVLSGKTPAGQKRIFELLRADIAVPSIAKAVKTDKYLDLQVGDAKVLRYHHAIVPAPEGKSPLYDRSAFIHPMWSTRGTVLTDIHPPDHIHHMGLWMPWTHTEFEGKPTDFWNLNSGQGTVRFVKYLDTTSGPVFGGFKAEQHHVALKTEKGEKVVLDEVWDVRAYNIGGPEDGYWLIDFKSTQRCVADSPLHQVKYRYGGFGWRGARAWKGENAQCLTSEGKNRENGNGTNARWCDAYGKTDEWEGITFFSHPKNFRHPEPMRLWPDPKTNLFFNFCPSVNEDWDMNPGQDFVFRYRMYVHQGKPVVADAERIWHDYAEPPVVTARFKQPSDAIVLFDGGDLSKWQREGGGEIKWTVANGELQIVPDSGSIVTDRPFTDFAMHLEFKIPNLAEDLSGQGRGNSGVYIQKRYEIQILDSYGLEPEFNGCGSIYRFKAPDQNVCKKPEQWQSYDIRFRAARFDGDKKVADARITVYQNGVLIHDDVAVPNKTGAGQPEGPNPGPILLQDHGNPVSFRNIWIVPL